MSEATETARDRLLRIVRGDFRVRRGHPLPYGAASRREGVNFSVFSKHATAVSLVLFVPGDREPVLELPLDPRYHKTGDVWHVFVEGLDPGVEYGFRADRSPNAEPQVLRFDPGKVLIDPFSKSVVGLEKWGEVVGPKGRLEALRSRVVDEEFDWGHEHPLAVPLAEVTLQNKVGDCDDLSFLYISLCRVLGIPARFIRGYLLTSYENGTADATAHAWVEVFVGGFIGHNGWIPVECACCTTSIETDIDQNFGVETAFI